MRKSGLTIGIAALLLGLGAAFVPLEPAYAQRNPCLGDGVSTQQEIDRRCAAARGVPYRGAYEAPRGQERRGYARERYERRGGYRDEYYGPRRGRPYGYDY
jgi:hypothetical protein